MEDMERRALLGVAGVAGIGALAAMAKAGPLTPPGGAVAPTGKTLQEIADKVARSDSGFAEARTPVSAATTPGNASYLFRITQPGSYYLTGNIQAPAGWTGGGIEIAASDVSLDLNGFAVVGVGGTGGFQAGLQAATPASSRVRVSNGTVRAWRSAGVALVARSQVSDIISEGNAGFGIICGNECIVSRCIAVGNTGTGIAVGSNCTLLQCVSQTNTGHGFTGSGSSVAALCTANANTLDGMNGFAAVENCLATTNSDDGFATCTAVSNCVANGNTDNGFDGCRVVRGCHASINSGDGASSCDHVSHSHFVNNTGAGVRNADLVMGCGFFGNTAGGVDVSTGASVIDNRFERAGTSTPTILAGSRCIIRGNTVVYGGEGIQASVHSLVEGNVVSIVGSPTNIVPGINASTSVIRNNVVSDGDGVGIQYTTGSVITGNYCRNNGGAAYSGSGLLGPVVTSQAGINTAVATINYSL